jgi:CRISPR system Cascade subunit CasD
VKSVLLRLCGPLQSWGTQGRFGVRDTDDEPSKSGVIGLVGAALGMKRDDRRMLARLASTTMAARVDREGTPLRDFHTVGGGKFANAPHGVWSIDQQRKIIATAVTTRHYLSDADFLVALGHDDHVLIDDVARALANPVWPLFLGRRSCSPSEPIFAGVVELSPEDALLRAPLEQNDHAPQGAHVRFVLPADSTTGVPRQDEPEDFTLYARKHSVRYVRMEVVDRESLLRGNPP